jgi:hypothetical protein
MEDSIYADAQQASTHTCIKVHPEQNFENARFYRSQNGLVSLQPRRDR